MYRFIDLDFESNAKNVRWDSEFRVMGWALAERESPTEVRTSYTPTGHLSGNVDDPDVALKSLDALLSDPHNVFIFHNAMFDADVIRRIDLTVPKRWYCTQQMFHWVDENIQNLKLDALGERFIGERKVHDPTMQLIIDKWGWGFIPVNILSKYAQQDAALGLKLFEYIAPKFIQQGFDPWLKSYMYSPNTLKV